MKRAIITLLIIFLSTLNSLAQWQTSENKIFYNGGNVGIGVSNPHSKLHVNGVLFLEAQDIVESWNASYFRWTGHRLIMGSPAGTHFHNSLELRPGGSDIGELHSEFKLFVAPRTNESELKVLIHSDGHTFFNGGNIGVGTATPDHKLDVVGTIRAHQVLVNTQKGADFVFEDGYNLRSLEEVEEFISENKHLPDIVSASTMVEEGVNMGELQLQLLQKMEEMTLYMIELKKENTLLKQEMEKMKGKIGD